MSPSPASDHDQLLETLRRVSVEQLAPLAGDYDRSYQLPLASLEVLRDCGALGLCAPAQFGGGGVSVLTGTHPEVYLRAVEIIGRVDMATAHCFQVHSHACMLLSSVCTPEQQERYLTPVARDGALVSWTGSEAQRTAAGQFKLTTKVSRDADGYTITGTKNYATLASAATWNIVAGNMADQEPGEAGFVLVMIPGGAEGLEIDDGWWRPMGMRATVSPVLQLSSVAVAEQDLILGPGQYPRLVKLDFGGKLHLSFAANFVGAAQGMLDFAVEYLPTTGRSLAGDVSQLIGRASARVAAARALLHQAVGALRDGRPDATDLALSARYSAISAATGNIPDVVEAVGSTALFERYPLERQIRDIHVQSTHSKQQVLSQTIGSRVLGLDHDISRQV